MLPLNRTVYWTNILLVNTIISHYRMCATILSAKKCSSRRKISFKKNFLCGENYCLWRKIFSLRKIFFFHDINKRPYLSDNGRLKNTHFVIKWRCSHLHFITKWVLSKQGCYQNNNDSDELYVLYWTISLFKTQNLHGENILMYINCYVLIPFQLKELRNIPNIVALNTDDSIRPL